MKLREKLINNYLPLWVKETVLRDNKRLTKENEVLMQKIRELESYVSGLEFGLEHRRDE